MLKKKPQDISFDSGIAHFYRKTNTASAGNLPQVKPLYLITLRYRRRTVGISRYYQAMQQQQQISEVIRCPLVANVEVNDICELPPSDKQYLVRQIQYPEDTALPVMDISLERLEGA